MSENIVKYETQTPSASVLIQGDLRQLPDEQRAEYYIALCNSLGLNPLTKPFDYIQLNGKLMLYAKKDCTEQLRKIHGVSIKILSRERLDDVYIVTAQAIDKHGRTDEAVGVVPLSQKVTGDTGANALMKAETKAKRRVTLSICGLGFLDESELDTVPYNSVRVSFETGEIVEDLPYKNYPSQKSLERLHKFFENDLSLVLNDEELSKLKQRYDDTIKGVPPDKQNKNGGYTEKRVGEVLGFWEFEYNKRMKEYEELQRIADEENERLFAQKY